MKIRNFFRIIGFIFRFPFLTFGKFVKRNNKIWVFGNKNGFVDNTKYLFQFINENHSEIQSIWLCENIIEKNKIEKLGYVSYNKYSLKGIYYAFKAGVGLLNNGLGDLNRFAVGGQILVYIGHGEPIKKIYLDSKKDWLIATNSIFSLLNKLSFFIFKKNQNLYRSIITSSKVTKVNLSTAFGIDKKNIAITGLPRTDIILDRKDKKIFNRKEEKQIILFAPTYREMGWPKIKNSYFNNNTWAQLLKKTNSIIYIKSHYFTQNIIQKEWKIEPSKYIRYLRNDKYNDINYLLPETDILITDYSSVSIDFSLLEKPIIFFTPDLELYKKNRGFYFDFENDISSGLNCLSWESLFIALESCLLNDNNKELYINNTIKLKKMFHHHLDVFNCERIYNHIFSII